MEGAGAGAGDNFQDWEVLHNSDSDSGSDSGLVNSDRPNENLRNFEEIEGDYSEGIIRSDYFSLDNENRYAKTSVVVDVSEEGSVESDNPSWIDPGSETRYQRKNSGEFWSDSGSDRSDERKFGDFQVGCEGVGEAVVVPKNDGLMKISGFDMGFDGIPEHGRSGSGEMTVDDHVKKHDESEIIIAAVMGLVILGRKLYKIKRKTRSLELKVTLDDKKVSQFMSRAARLNEAFSVVRRVPIIRPALPAPGVNSWPVMSLR
ncbi:hypothetical protein QYF36_018147 [Acer negundo]|nr:hypothetical protein QYF36_018147 [Acer negundo]